MNEELKKKLAEWAGFTVDLSLQHSGAAIDPSGKHIYESPNFAESLDACFKWLIPEVTKKGFIIETYTTEDDTAVTITKAGKTYAFVCQPKFALALCLAIEKLIDKEVTNEGNQNPNPTT